MEQEYKEDDMPPSADSKTMCSSLKNPIRRAHTWEFSDSESDNETITEDRGTGSNSSPCALRFCAFNNSISSQQCSFIGGEASVVAQPIPIPPLSSPAKKKVRKKQSPKELESSMVQIEARKLGKETKRLEKERAKELVRLERENKRLEKERQKEHELQERQSRKEMSDAIKFLRPDQCMKHMSICVDTGILEDGGSDELLETLSSLDCRYFIEPQRVPQSITWRREMPPGWSGMSGLEVKDGEEEEMLVLVGPEDFLKSVYSLRKGSSEAPAVTQSFAFDVADRHPEKKICLIVIGLEPYRYYIKQLQRTGDRTTRSDSRSQRSPEHSLTRRQIQEALVVLQLWSHTDVLFVDTWLEFAQHIVAVTKAIAQRPFKKRFENQAFSFCTTEGRWTSGVRVEKDGKGLQHAWKRQIQQFNRVSPSMAAAVTGAYPSPNLLLQGYEGCSTEKEKLNLLAGLTVKKEKYSRQECNQDLNSQVKESQSAGNKAMEDYDSLVKLAGPGAHSLWEESSQKNEETPEPNRLEKEMSQFSDSLGKEESQAAHRVGQESQAPVSLGMGDIEALGSPDKQESQGTDTPQKQGSQNSDTVTVKKDEGQSAKSMEQLKKQDTNNLMRENSLCPEHLGKDDLSTKNPTTESLTSADCKGLDPLSTPEDIGRARRLGPDLSRRIYIFMFATNPDLVLDLGS
ncbi:structure-specific endonuclease subunit EME2 [Lissotriton helveticus]